MKHLNEYNIFGSDNKHASAAYIRITNTCLKYNIENYTINPDGSIDVDGDVSLSEKNLTKIPLKFNRVTGYFYCQNNKLTTLEGSPKYVGRSFCCSHCGLTSLEGGPKYVGSSFTCYGNKLTSLKGSPDHVGLEFDCRHCGLTTLEGSPKYVCDHFSCSSNNLISIEGCTENIGGFFSCEWNPIYSILGGWFVNKKSNTRFIELFNYCDIVQGKNVIYDRLKYFFEEVGVELSWQRIQDIKNHYKIIY